MRRWFLMGLPQWLWPRHRSVSGSAEHLRIEITDADEARLRERIKNREEAIEASNVRKVFTPAKPIDDLGLFVGRTREVQQIVGHLNRPGQHALLWGDRGVGKTSLAKYLAKNLKDTIHVKDIFYASCSADVTLVGILKDSLKTCGCDTDVVSTTRTAEVRGSGKVSVKMVEGSLDAGIQRSESRHGPADGMTPTEICRLIKDTPALLIVDEADRIQSPAVKMELAELLKQLSDAGAQFKVLIVGVAQAGADLVANHPSVGRCVSETHLGVMPQQELEEIVRSGSKRVGLNVDEEVITAIGRISGGYAYYVHLLALKCGEEVVASGGRHVNMAILLSAMRLATDEAEESLSTVYSGATRSSANDKCRTILKAAVMLDKREFASKELKDEVYRLSGRKLDRQYLNRLVSDDGHTILRRMQHGIYRFSDPRMPGYIKIVNGMIPVVETRIPLDRSS